MMYKLYKLNPVPAMILCPGTCQLLTFKPVRPTRNVLSNSDTELD